MTLKRGIRGDNPGDSKDIMAGWQHYENTRRKAAQ